MPVDIPNCPRCQRPADEGLERCDFCGNLICYQCDPNLFLDLAQLCSSCVKLRDTLRASENSDTNLLRRLNQPLPLPAKPVKVTRCWKLRVAATRLINLARTDRVTPGLDAKADRLWRRLLNVLNSFNK